MKKFLSVVLALAMLLSVGAVVAFAADPCACEGCEAELCECVGTECADDACACACHEAEEEPVVEQKLSGYELWKFELTEGKLGGLLQKMATWGDWILKILYYVCFGWLYNFVVDVTVTRK